MTGPLVDVSALARKWAFDVNTGTEISPTWTRVRGVMEFKPSLTPNMEDDSVYDDAGWQTDTKTALKWGLEVKVVRRHDPADEADYDAGQEKLRALSELFGGDGIAHVRWYDRFGGPEAYEGFGDVQWVPDGGAMTALETVVITISPKGAREAIDNPIPSS